jgi:hypothetical protein
MINSETSACQNKNTRKMRDVAMMLLLYRSLRGAETFCALEGTNDSLGRGA